MNSIGAEQVKSVGIGAVEVKSIGIGAVQVRCTGSIHMQSIGTVEVNIINQKCFLNFFFFMLEVVAKAVGKCTQMLQAAPICQ